MRASPKFAAGLHNAELRKNVRRNHHKSTVIRYSTSVVPGRRSVGCRPRLPRREGGRRVLHYILPAAAGNAARRERGSGAGDRDKRKFDNCPWITGPCRT